MFKDFLHENQVVELIFTDSPHPELIKRSLEMLYLRADDKQHPVASQLTEVIWKCCTERHEAVNKAAFTVL